MGKESSIQWTHASWNIAVGCDKVDADCKFCYMYRDSLKGKRYTPNVVRRTKQAFKMPLKLKEPSLIFTCSLTDFFHEGIDSFRDEAWDIIRKCPQHIFQILTKRPERIKDHLPPDWGEGWDNVWLGTSVGSADSMHRAKTLALYETNCIKFLSMEPLHGEINPFSYDVQAIHPDNEGYGVGILSAFDWVIVGGESGNEIGQYRYRPCQLEWIELIVDECKCAGTPVFVKQLGTHLSTELGITRHGGIMEEWPKNLQTRQFPKNHITND